MDTDDRISNLEQRLQLQEDEMQVLRAALSDALRRLRVCEDRGDPLRGRQGERSSISFRPPGGRSASQPPPPLQSSE